MVIIKENYLSSTRGNQINEETFKDNLMKAINYKSKLGFFYFHHQFLLKSLSETESH